MSSNTLHSQMASAFLSGQNMSYIEALYEDYLHAKHSVSTEWQEYFASLQHKNSNGQDISHRELIKYFKNLAIQKKLNANSNDCNIQVSNKSVVIEDLINAYRKDGHWLAKIDPLGSIRQLTQSRLRLEQYEAAAQLIDDQNPSKYGSFLQEKMTASAVISALKETYCSAIGLEFMHLVSAEEINWFAEKMESSRGRGVLNTEQQIKIFKDLVAADGLERYLGSRFVGQKRFSLEGGDSLIPMMKAMLDKAADSEVKEVVIGMAHRGRLNMLVNVLGKCPQELFDEFEGKIQTERTGDVKYHAGFSSDIKTSAGKIIHVALGFNPSHLEIIGPVIEGSVRARLQRQNDIADKNKVVPVLIHGDAAFSGQGVIMETFNFSQVPDFCTGGTVHIVINNQIGFTTSLQEESRSTYYCTDIAKMIDAPIIHVNGNDPEACVFAMQLAFAFRMQFKRDIVIDLVCYRRHGHNEADEPSMTQPLMYQKIKAMPTMPEIYGKILIERGLISQDTLKQSYNIYRDKLDKGECLVTLTNEHYDGKVANDWTPYLNTKWNAPVDTSLSLASIKQLSITLETLPENLSLHPAIAKLMAERQQMTAGKIPINWGYAETLAYASLLDANYAVRLSGEDAERGTFAHRQAVLHDIKTGERYIPLKKTVKDKPFFVINDPLSEEGVLAFEYGYASSDPNTLVLWEAQFGDFANCAQVVIDQFISSGEQKWGRLCGLVLLLPHGYEGQGPEHSSARLERFMQLCAQHNMQVCIPTTPAQIFHLLRRQMLRPFRKPLIVMTPKSLLRHKLAISSLDDLANGEFKNIISEVDVLQNDKITRVVVCSGKVYYDLLQKRREKKRENVAILRIEQLYPFPEDLFKAELSKYSKAKDIIWCQEEPQNQGAWYASQHHLRNCLKPHQEIHYAGRSYAASPAVGSAKLHVKEQEDLVSQALDL